MGVPTIGNNDYRGYLNYLSQKSNDPTYRNPATTLLKLVGNDAKFGKSGFEGSDLARRNQELYQEFLGNQAAGNIGSIYGGGGGGGGSSATVYAPKLDYASVNAQARQQAEAAVNPLYTAQLNTFIKNQGIKKAQQQAQYQTQVKSLEDALKQTMEDTATTRTRTTEDVAKNMDEVALAGEQFQEDTGQEFDATRMAEAATLANSGVAGSGLGVQKQEATQAARNTQEGRQEVKFQQQKDEQQTFKTRTFEDMFKKDVRAKEGTETGKKQAKFDLDSYIQNQGIEQEQYRQDQEIKRQGDILLKEGAARSNITRSWVESIADPASREAARRAYL